MGFQVEIRAVFSDAGGDYPDEVVFEQTVEQREGPSPSLDTIIAEARGRAARELPMKEEGLRLTRLTVELSEKFW
jgi:hypothetical protein